MKSAFRRPHILRQRSLTPRSYRPVIPAANMPSSTQSTNHEDASTPQQQPQRTQTTQTSQDDPSQTLQDDQNPSSQPLPLPEPSSSSTTKIDMSAGGTTVKLDHLGPLVVNKDGTLSRIANWEQMADIERQNTLRILGKRNMLRREALQKAEDESTKQD
jgi:hypothetical protein